MLDSLRIRLIYSFWFFRKYFARILKLFYFRYIDECYKLFFKLILKYYKKINGNLFINKDLIQ